MLDGLRGLAAFAVMAMHCQFWLNSHGLFGHAYLAVDFFFLLSGFVVAHSYGGKLERGRLSTFEFIRVRIVRLYPLIFLSVAVAGAFFALRWHSGHRDPGVAAIIDAVWRSLLLAPHLKASPIADEVYPLNGPLWSLFYELAINLVYVLAYRWLRSSILLALTLAGAVGLVGAMLACGHLDLGASPANFGWGAARVTFGFFGGVFVQRLWASGRLRVPHPPLWLIVAILVFIFAAPRAWPGRGLFDLVSVLLVFPVLLVAALGVEMQGAAARISRLAGDLSYPVYVLQKPIFWWMGGVFRAHGQELPPPMPGLIAMAVVIGAAWLALKLYDEPLRRLLSFRGRSVIEGKRS